MPLKDVEISIENQGVTLTGVSDENGEYRIAGVPVGRCSIYAETFGYEPVFFSSIVVTSGREVVMNIPLREAIQSIGEVDVFAEEEQDRALNSMVSVSSTQLTIESTQRVAAGINDPARTAQSFAGVATSDDEGNELVIRGNSPRGMLWRMEGIEIPNPNHFTDGEGSSGGGVSALSTLVLDNSDFMTGAFPAEYGNALSGVFDLRLRNGNSENREYSAQIGVLGMQLSAEGPFVKGEDASYLVNYRYSTLELLSAAGIDISGGDIVPVFQDLSYKINIPTKSFGRFAIWGLWAKSSAGSTAIEDSSLWVYRSDRFANTENHGINIVGATHFIGIGTKAYLKTTAAFTYNSFSMIEDSVDYNGNHDVIQENVNQYRSFRINSFINHKFDAKNVLRAGATFELPMYDLLSNELNWNTNEMEIIVDDEGSSSIYRGYAQWQHRFSTRWELNLGAHATYFDLNGDFAIEPRAAATWYASDKHMFSAGFGLHSRIEPLSIYLAEVEQGGASYQPNLDLEMTKALHYVVSHKWKVGTNTSLKTELYYQSLYDVPVHAGDTTGVFSALNFSSGTTNLDLVNEGTGMNYGVEMTLDRQFNNGFYYMVTAALFESKYKIPGFELRDTRYSSNYMSSLMIGKEWRLGSNDQNILGANIRTIWRGGYRFIPIDLDQSNQAGYAVLDYDKAYSDRYPDYFRVDLGVSYQQNNEKWSWKLSVNLQNTTNRLNVWGNYYDAERGTIESYYMNGLLPVINYRVDF